MNTRARILTTIGAVSLALGTGAACSSTSTPSDEFPSYDQTIDMFESSWSIAPQVERDRACLWADPSVTDEEFEEHFGRMVNASAVADFLRGKCRP